MRVAATSDSIVEGNETYTLNAGIGAQTPVNGLGTISDATAALTVASVSAATGAEGTNLKTVNLSGSNATGATTVSLSGPTAAPRLAATRGRCSCEHRRRHRPEQRHAGRGEQLQRQRTGQQPRFRGCVAATSDSIVEGNDHTLNAGIGAQTPVNGWARSATPPRP